MPRSKNPHAYPMWTSALFGKLTNPQCESEIVIEAGTHKRAHAMRHMFYSYVTAKERQGKNDPQALDDCAMVRRFLIRVQESAGIWVLVFKDRNTEPDALDILDQVMKIGTVENPAGNSQLSTGSIDPDSVYVDPDTKWSNTIGSLFKSKQ